MASVQPAAEPLTVLAPVYNEKDNFPRLIAEVEQHIPPPFTLRVIYDVDEDNTVPVARDLARTRPWLKLLKNGLGRGVVNALRTGFLATPSGPCLVVMADLSDDLRIVPRLLDLYRQGYQIVCPSRYMPGGRQIGGRWLKRTLSRSAGLSLYWLAGFPTRDATNNFRLYDAQLVQEMGIESTGGFELALELTSKAFLRGAKIIEVPTTWRDRTAGQSRFRLWKWLPRYLYWYWRALSGRRHKPAVHQSHLVHVKVSIPWLGGRATSPSGSDRITTRASTVSEAQR